MPPKATTLYLKIARETTEADHEELRRVKRLQDSKLKEGEFHPIGELLIDEDIITKAQHKEILVQHSFTNCKQDDRLFGEWLVDKGSTTNAFVEESLLKTNQALQKGQKKIPRLATALLQEEDVDRDLIVRMNEHVLQPLHEMTRYFEAFVGEGEDDDVIYGRIAYQNQLLKRENLFAALVAYDEGGDEDGFFEFLVDSERITEYEEAMINGYRAGFG
mgnify:CR=1 FL=1